MKVFVVTVHLINNRHRFGPVIGTPKVFTTWDRAHRYGVDRVRGYRMDYTRTDFKITEAEQ